MIHNKNKLRVPEEYRYWITKEDRIEAFKEITKGYEKYGIKCIYAFLNTDPDFMIDYALVYKGRNDANTRDLILYDTVPINSDRCTPQYRYYKMVGKEEQFFQFGIEEMVIMDKDLFYHFIVNKCQLSRDKKDEKFWKKIENAKELTDEMLENQLPYNRPKKKEYIE